MASIGRDCVLLVDTGSAAMSDKVLATVRELSRQITSAHVPQQSCVGLAQGCTWWDGSKFLSTTVSPPPPRRIAGIINTSFDADHVGGNFAIATAGASYGARVGEPAWIIAHENAPTQAPKTPVLPAEAMPTETYFGTDLVTQTTPGVTGDGQANTTFGVLQARYVTDQCFAAAT